MIQRTAYFIGCQLVRRRDNKQIASPEIGAEIALTLHNDNAKAQKHGHSRYRHELGCVSKEVEPLRTNEVKHGHPFEPTQSECPRKAGVGDQQRGKHRCDDTDSQRQCETLNRSTRQPEKNCGCKKLRYVRIEDSAERFSI